MTKAAGRREDSWIVGQGHISTKSMSSGALDDRLIRKIWLVMEST